MSYPRYRGDGAVIDRPDQSIPDADGAVRSSWMAGRNARLTESFDAIVPIPMTRELRHKRLHIATVAKASRGRSECDAMRGTCQRSFAVSDTQRQGTEAATSVRGATKQNARLRAGVAVEAGTSEYLVAGARSGQYRGASIRVPMTGFRSELPGYTDGGARNATTEAPAESPAATLRTA
jgi:hypothetical protein